MLIGVLVLAGWHWHSAVLIQIAPNLAPMQRNTALGLILSGAGFLSWIGKGRQNYVIWIGETVAILGAITLIEYFFSIDLRIDQFLGSSPAVSTAPIAGCMSALTSFCFTLIGPTVNGLEVLEEMIKTPGSALNPGGHADIFAPGPRC